MITETAPCQKSIRLTVPPDAIAALRQAVLGEFQRQAALPGFRKGKAPPELVGRQYAKDIQDETLHRVTRQTFERITETHQLKPVGPFELRRADFTDAGLTLEAVVEVEPAFALAAYKGIPLTREPSDPMPQEVEQALNGLRESMAQLVPATEPGTPPEGGVGEGSAEGRSPRPTEPGNPAPSDLGRGGRGNPEAAGRGTTPPPKKERQLPALDDEFAKDLGFGALAKLREHVETKVGEQKRSAAARVLESALCDELLRRHTFEVPPGLVAHQADRLTNEFKARLLLSGVAEAKVEEEAAKFTGELRMSAERLVKLGFILDRIAAQESVAVTQDELVGRMWQLAQRSKQDPAKIRRVFDERGLWPSVVSSIRQEKTIALLMGAAAITNGAAGPTTTTSV